jgi:fatty-acyl-CoA synthase
MTPARILKRAVKLYADKTAVVDGNIRLTYREVQQRVNRVVHAIQDLKLSSNARIAVVDYNTYRYMELYFGGARSGRILSPLNIRLSEEEYVHILGNSRAEAVIFHQDFKPMMERVRRRVSTVNHWVVADGEASDPWITHTYEGLMEAASPEDTTDDIHDENATLNLYYTSGTTGRPKGVELTHRNIYANALTTIISFKIDDATTWHHIAPLFHLADAFFIWSVTFQGGCHVMQRNFVPVEVLATMEKERVVAAMMVPTMINFLLDVPGIDRYDLSALEWIMVGGAPMSPANAERMMEKLGCRYLSGYGLTETTPLLTVGNLKSTLADRSLEERLGFVTRTGLEVTGVDLRVVDANGEDVPWDSASVGEIIVRGDNVMKGYWEMPEETENAIRNGYFYTGDLACVDSQGYVLIVDRAKDIIISGGENIGSVEVENAIYTHPDVLECAVIAMADERWGEVPKAVVVLRQGAEVVEQQLIDHCRERLARFKAPKKVVFVKALPKTGSGKILKVKLREIS